VDVEVLDVNDAEARALLLAIDPLAQLAGYEADTLDELRRRAEAESAAAKSLWQVIEKESERGRRDLARRQAEEPPEQYFVLIECEDENQQRELLKRFHDEGLKCQAKMS